MMKTVDEVLNLLDEHPEKYELVLDNDCSWIEDIDTGDEYHSIDLLPNELIIKIMERKNIKARSC